MHLSQDKSPTDASPSYLPSQAKPEAIREPVCMLLVPHKNKHYLGFCSRKSHKYSAMKLMIINCKLAVKSAFLTFPFHLSPVLYQTMIPDFFHQRPDPKNKKSVEAFLPALLGFGLGPSEKEH